ncbi:MAG: hypothetical protein ABIP51_17900 [Bacteroidia bacterium]
MKTFKAFLKQLKKKPVYLEDFSCREDVFSNFNKTEDPDILICIAVYYPGDYCGDATVIYYRKSTNKYYQTYGSHCSCYGLENQWESDEEINMIELEGRILRGEEHEDGSLLCTEYLKFQQG